MKRYKHRVDPDSPQIMERKLASRDGQPVITKEIRHPSLQGQNAGKVVLAIFPDGYRAPVFEDELV